MPQIAPMNWLMLFMMFIIIFSMFNSLNYFCFLYNPKKFLMTKKNIYMNWKW